MANVIARGQITILDYNDAISLNAYIGANQPLTQIYTQDTGGFMPSWTSTPWLKLTPQLFKSGSSTDVMGVGTDVQSVTWTSNGVVVAPDANHVKNANAPWDLTIKVNELAMMSQKNYECTIIWRDPNTNLDITVKSSITFTKVINAGSLISAIGYTPDGSIYKNNSVTSLKAHCDLWRGSSIDTTNVSYKWFKKTANVFAPTTSMSATTIGGNVVTLTTVANVGIGTLIKVGAESAKTVTNVNPDTRVVTISGTFSAVIASGAAVTDPRYDSVAGLDWSIINATYSYDGITGYTSNEITIPSASVLNFETFKCCITDTDSSSPTYNQTVSDILSFSDLSDPIAVDIEASNGNILRNGVGSTVLTASLWRSGAKIDTVGTQYNYKWIRFNEAGTQDLSWGVGGVKTGKTVTIVDADVNGKATFYCNIETLT